MTKAEIVKEVSKSTGIENATVSAVVEGFMEAVKGSLAKEIILLMTEVRMVQAISKGSGSILDRRGSLTGKQS